MSGSLAPRRGRRQPTSEPSLDDTRIPISVSIEREELAQPVELVVTVTETGSGAAIEKRFRFLAPFGLTPAK